jgi:hypothetical protein
MGITRFYNCTHTGAKKTPPPCGWRGEAGSRRSKSRPTWTYRA